ncbi:hypothetical protein L799_09450 [Enterobacter roggenkampii EC_38VIM1]|nr:hypothetical protein L799_09450 [Enterobacter roggenkampii EC_38VIM1]
MFSSLMVWMKSLYSPHLILIITLKTDALFGKDE